MESVREMIEKRAYELFLARGGLHGYAIQDWNQAEKEVLAEVDHKKAKVSAPKSVEKPAPAKPIEKAAEQPLSVKEDVVNKKVEEEPKAKTVKAPASAATASAKKRATKKKSS